MQKIEKIKNPAVRDQMHELLMEKMKKIGRSDLALLSLPKPPSGTTPIGTPASSTSFTLPKPTDGQDET
jgi:hypothetical protein